MSVSAPLRVHDDVVRAAIVARLPWIRRHLATTPLPAAPPALEYITGEIHLFLGRSYVLNITEHAGRARVVLRDDANIDLFVPARAPSGSARRILEHWYRAHLKQRIPALIAQWEPIIGVQVAEWGVKRMRTKWGTCNIRARRIWLGLELARRDDSALEYIIVHELVHLLERNHNARFRAFMDQFLPDWRTRLQNLNAPHPNPFLPC